MKATLEADFSSFHAEAVKADADMGKLAQSAASVDKALDGMSSSHGKAASASNSAVTALRQFDGVLSSVGLNINNDIRAIDEFAQAAGKSTSQIGALGSVGLVAGAALAGWEIGRTIASVFGLDEAIVHLTGSSQKLKNEIAGAQLDTITRAMALGAPATITYADAVDFLTKRQKEAQVAQKAYEEGIKALSQAGGGLNATLQTIDGTVVEAIKFYIDAGVSQKDLAAAYGLTAAQVRAVAEARKDDIETIKIQQEMDKVTTELALQHQKDWREEIQRTTKERNDTVIAGIGQIKQAEADLSDFLAKEALSSTDYQIKKIWDVAAEQKAAFKGTEEQRGIFDANIEARANEAAERLKQKARDVANATVQAEIDAINALNAIIPTIGHGPTTPNGQGPAPIFVKPIDVGSVFHQNTNLTLPARAGGGPVSAGQAYMVGERGPELFVPGSSGSIAANGGGMNITINVTQPLGTPTAIADAVADALAKQYRGRGVRSN